MELLNAKWIWCKETATLPNQYCEFIKEINIKSVENSKIYISATSDYELFVNGSFVASRQYGDYPDNKSYDTLEIGDFLKVGKNKIAVLGYNMGCDTFAYINDTAGIIFAIENGDEKFYSDAETYFRVPADYKQGEMEKVSPQLGWTFEFDATKSDNWKEFDYKIGDDWAKIGTENIQNKTYNFFPRPIAKLEKIVNTDPEIIVSGSFIRKKNLPSAGETIYNDFLGVSVLNEKIPLPGSFQIEKDENGDGVYYIIDLGKEVAGNIYFDIDCQADTVLEIGYGEQLENLRVQSFIECRNFAFRYFAKAGENIFTHRLLRLAGRYLEVHVTGKATIKSCEIVPTDYNAPLVSSYNSVNKLENKINEMCVRTLRICMHEHFEDTPWREQGLYGMDSRNQALCNYYAFADYNFVKSCLRTFAGTFGEDGFFEITSPTKFDFTIPCFTFAWIMMIKDYLLYSGDYEFALEMLPQIKYTIDTVIKKIDDTGLLPTDYSDRFWNYTEWSDGLDGAHGVVGSAGDYSLPFNAFLAMALESYIWILERIDNFEFRMKNEEFFSTPLYAVRGELETPCNVESEGDYELLSQDFYKNILNKLRTSAEKMFWVEEKKYYKSFLGGLHPNHFAQLSGALAILAGFGDEEKFAFTREKIVSDKSLVECTLSMFTYKYEALLQDKKYADFVFDEIENQWGEMIAKGSTTCWETQKGCWDFNKAGSTSHAWSAVPLYFYYAYLLGVRPTEPGFEKYVIDPVKKNYVDAKVWTPKGVIEICNL